MYFNADCWWSSNNAPDLWSEAAEQLKEKDRETLHELQSTHVSPQDLLTSVAEQKEKCESKQWELKRRKGKEPIILRHVFGRIIEWLQKFIQVGDVAVQYDPGHATLPWAAFRFLLVVYDVPSSHDTL